MYESPGIYAGVGLHNEFVKMLEVLQSQMWLETFGWGAGKVPASINTSIEEYGKLNKLEVESILDTAIAYDMPVILDNFGFGIGKVGVKIYSNEQFIGDMPERLFALSENHLDEKHFPWVDKLSFGGLSSGAWDLFSKYTHSDSMRKRLDFSGLEKPRSRDRYEY